MENEKYYTPTIEEFYVGFEFEYYCEEGSLLSKDDSICEFRNESFDSDWANIMFDEYEHEDKEYIKSHYRVKYLDKLDIESLGFKQKDYNWYFVYEKNKTINLIYMVSKDNEIHITIETNLSILETGPFYNTFSGIIKNKSELKILLKQLNIN